MTPSHYIIFKINNGIKIEYHLNKLSGDNIQVLAIVVTFNDYTLTLEIDNYDAIANQPTPHYDVLTTCDCDGACVCHNFKKNDTDDSDNNRPIIRSHIIYPPASY